jgi:hypothetical protein
MAQHVSSKAFDVVVAGGGTAGVVAALAAARNGAKTVLVEGKGYTGGTVVEGGTALHSFYNLWKAFPGVEKRQVVRGIPQEIVDRLVAVGGTCGHAEMERGFDYDSVCTAIDVELYKLVTLEMLEEAGVHLYLNTLLTGAEVSAGTIEAVLAQSRSGAERIEARAFVDCTGYGDLAAFAGARFCELNDHGVANSIGVGGVSVEGYLSFLERYGAVGQLAKGQRGGRDNQIVRIDAAAHRLPAEFVERVHQLGLHLVVTTLHDDYFMFLKLNYKMDQSPTDRDAVARAELELRRRQKLAVELFREFVPGCEKAFIARSSPSLCIRRGRTILCDYDLSLEEILGGRRFDDEIALYGFHDCAPRLKIQNGGVYGIPYRALLPEGLSNLLVTGMMITTNYDAHMSTRNTVSCMAMGQAAGTAAALSARAATSTRSVDVSEVREQLRRDGACLEY